MEPNRETVKWVKDPVCGKDVAAGIARGWDYRYEEAVYHFCGSECRRFFSLDPRRVLARGPGPANMVEPPSQAPERPFFQALIEKGRSLFSK